MASEIFISYRRSDAGWAGRIYDRLEDEFKADDLFMDVENIAAGHNFDAVIKKQAESSKVMLVIIGEGWVADDSIGRLHSIDDFVRREIEIGLKKKKGGIIPVLIEPAPYLVSVAQKLPDTLQGLSALQALDVTHKGFRADVQRLVFDEIAGGTKRDWDRTAFLDAARQARGDALAKRFTKVLDWARDKYNLSWGNGAKYGTAQIFPKGGRTAFSIDHTGTLFIFMLGLEKMGAFKSHDERQEFVDQLNNIHGISITRDRTGNDFIGFQINNVDLDDMDQLLELFDRELAKLGSS